MEFEKLSGFGPVISQILLQVCEATAVIWIHIHLETSELTRVCILEVSCLLELFLFSVSLISAHQPASPPGVRLQLPFGTAFTAELCNASLLVAGARRNFSFTDKRV
jgi:hypothetical protein